jgi:hypothetical protein
MQVADPAASTISLTRNLPIMFKQIMQGNEQGPEIELTCRTSSSAADTNGG